MELKTKSGIIIPSSAVDWEGKTDRSQAAAVRAMVPGMSGGGGIYGVSRFKEYADFLTAVKVPWVYPCIRLISHTFAKTKWTLMNGASDVGTPTNPYVQLMTRPNPHQSGYRWKFLYSLYMELLGEAFITLENRDGYGRPRELYLPNPAYMTVIPDPKNFVAGYIFRPMGVQMSQGIPYMPEEVIHVKHENPNNPWRGLGTVEANAIILDIAEAVAMHEKAYFGSGGRIIGVLETEAEVSPDDFNRLKEEWRAFSMDKQQRLKTAILQSGLKYTPIAEGLKNINVVDINKEKRDAILGAWGVPKTKLGIIEDAQYKLNDADRTFDQETMDPKYTLFEEEVQPLVDLWNPAWRHEFERINYEDDTTKINNARGMAATYAIEENEIRDYLGYPERKGGDVILAPSQMTPIRLSDMGDIAGAAADELINPPEPSPMASTAPVVPGPSTAGQNGNGAKPAGPPAEGENLAKMLADIPDTDDGIMAKAQLRLDFERREKIAAHLASKMAGASVNGHRPNHRLGPARGDTFATKGTKQYMRTSTRAPALAVAKVRRRDRYEGSVRERAIGEIRRAFRSQQRAVVKRINELVKPVEDSARTRAVVSARVAEAIPAEPMADVLGALHASAITAGFAAGETLLDTRNRGILNQRLAAKKEAHPEGKQIEYIAPDASGWRTAAEEWRQQFPMLDKAMNQLGERITGIDNTTRDKITDQITEGLRRGYSSLQIAQGYADENYDGIAGVFEGATDWRAEMIARTEARNAFERGSWAAYAMGEVPALEAVDGETFDEMCRNRNGEVYQLTPDGTPNAPADVLEEHPNGTLTWVPAVLSVADVNLLEGVPEQ